ncbi:MAG: hypothetical protein AAF533_11960 [Acidobacteriota bacterium]
MSDDDRPDSLPEPEALLELPPGTRSIPIDFERASLPDDHLSFEDFWATLEMPDDREHRRLKELFYEWLGQHHHDVHRRDEPTIFGDHAGWLEIWNQYRKNRKLT